MRRAVGVLRRAMEQAAEGRYLDASRWGHGEGARGGMRGRGQERACQEVCGAWANGADVVSRQGRGCRTESGALWLDRRRHGRATPRLPGATTHGHDQLGILPVVLPPRCLSRLYTVNVHIPHVGACWALADSAVQPCRACHVNQQATAAHSAQPLAPLTPLPVRPPGRLRRPPAGPRPPSPTPPSPSAKTCPRRTTWGCTCPSACPRRCRWCRCVCQQDELVHHGLGCVLLVMSLMDLAFPVTPHCTVPHRGAGCCRDAVLYRMVQMGFYYELGGLPAP